VFPYTTVRLCSRPALEDLDHDIFTRYRPISPQHNLDFQFNVCTPDSTNLTECRLYVKRYLGLCFLAHSYLTKSRCATQLNCSFIFVITISLLQPAIDKRRVILNILLFNISRLSRRMLWRSRERGLRREQNHLTSFNRLSSSCRLSSLFWLQDRRLPEFLTADSSILQKVLSRLDCLSRSRSI
jgi:hypothetical protein